MYPNNDIYSQFRAGNFNSSFRYKSNFASNRADNHKINFHALAGSTIGTLIPVVIARKRQNTSLLKITYEFREMIFIGTGAILGGLTGSIIRDKKEKVWKKIKEANFQWITNLFLPTLFVDQFIKYADKKFPEKINSTNNKIAKAIAVIAGIGAGMKFGEFLTDKINCRIGKGNKHKRKIKTNDILLHIDDIPIALTLSKVPYIDKLLPFCFIYSGYQAGKE